MKIRCRCPHCNLEFDVNFPVKKRVIINVPTQPQPIKYSDPLSRKLIGKDFRRDL